MHKLAITVLAVSLVAGCTRGESSVTARARFCKQFAEYKAAVAAMPAMNANTKVSDVRASLDRVRREYKALSKDAQRLDAARAQDLERAEKNFERSIQELPGKATLAEAQTRLAGPAAELRAASDQMSASAQCSGMSGQ
jgi:hypothetical protein